MDGGLYDNVPFRMARKRGYRKIILVDISGIGFNRRLKTEGTQTVYIKNSVDMGNAFDFDPIFIDRFWQLGYLDTMRTFGRLVGYQFFIEPNEQAELEWKNEEITRALVNLEHHYPDKMRHDQRRLLKTLEVCAELLEVDRIKQYSYDQLTQAVIDKVTQITSDIEQLIESRGINSNSSPTKLLDAFAKEIFENKNRNDNPYFYLKLIGQFKTTKTLQLVEKTVRKLNPELAILEAFLTLNNFNIDK